MSDIQSIRDDLAYMRGLADDGRRPSRGGGVILAVGGFVYGAASLAAGGMVTGVLPGGAAGLWAPWLAATLVFYAVLFVQLRAIKRDEPRSVTAPATLSGLAWSGMGGAAFSVILAAVAAGWATGSALVWAVMPSVFLALYGVGWTVAAAASGAAWMRSIAILSFASATAIAFLAASPLMWLAYGAALIGLAGVPGLLLARKPLAAA